MPAASDPDWTTGPAKWAAVVVLGAASVTGIAWSILARQPHPRLWPPSAVAPPVAAIGEPAAPAGDHPPAAAPSPTRIINLNTATAAELDLLPGIGPALAQRIVEDREKRGPFKSIDNLDRVRGIGPETIRRIRPLVTVE